MKRGFRKSASSAFVEGNALSLPKMSPSAGGRLARVGDVNDRSPSTEAPMKFTKMPGQIERNQSAPSPRTTTCLVFRRSNRPTRTTSP